jgi:hypothetical protein
MVPPHNVFTKKRKHYKNAKTVFWGGGVGADSNLWIFAFLRGYWNVTPTRS